MHNRLLLFFGLFAMSIVCRSQTYSIVGSLLERDTLPLHGATISLVQDADSSKKSTVSDAQGEFSFTGLKSGHYQLKASYIGFITLEKAIIILNGSIQLGKIILSVSNNTLDEVRILERSPRVLQKGDTTEFDAKSYSANADASVEDLIKKMPGIEVSSSTATVKAQGEMVVKILLDGKPFMGNDASMALKNLPADIVSKIQVYDQRSEQSQFTGFSDGQTSKTINIVTKPDRRNGQFGKAYAGYGSDYRYQAGANINNFRGPQRISILGQSNNINNSKFTAVEVPANRTQGGGIATSNAGAINYTNTIGTSDLTASYSFEKNNIELQRSLFREYVSDSGLQYKQSDRTTSIGYVHKFNLRYDLKTDSMNSVLIQPIISIQQGDGYALSDATMGDNSQLLTQTTNSNRSTTNGYNIASDFLYRHRFQTQRRTLSSMLNVGSNDNRGQNTLKATSMFSDSASIDQRSNLANFGWHISVNPTYTEPMGEKGIVQVNYNFSLQDNTSQKNTYNYSSTTSKYDLKDSLFTNKFRSITTTQQFGLGYNFTNAKLNLSLGLSYQTLIINNKEEQSPLPDLTRKYINILPSAVANYKLALNKNLAITYRMTTIQPSVGQLQNVINNTNPILLTTGNPQLKQAYQHSLMTRYSMSTKEKSHSFFASATLTYTDKYITNSTYLAVNDVIIDGEILLKKGGQITMPVNLTGNYVVNSNVTYSAPLSAIKSNLNSSISYNYRNSPALVNNQINTSSLHAPGISLSLTSNINEKLDFSLASSVSYTLIHNGLQANTNNTFLSQTNTATLYWMFWRNFVCQTSLTGQFFSGLSSEYNQKYLLWNLSLAKKFLKNDRGEIRLSVFDVLRENNSIQRIVTNLYFEDQRAQVLMTYYMITFTYTFRDFSVKK
ncbi:MAG: outer membrane beta-barrel protein [Candidatus Pedobacter colombiensis]|uniref:Outer membrane beta-barrel protein n=1 Tax=Candidatus Pedobacter colombiensis TaxID=3121371 RepID=A0AAJ5WB33_9SPHI|nr:outer membrane beta-barrel protein [Pedobacter sp.]WEK21307.1 MAG: outer membrane beta-barrel protein [Pedobacter sp.]